MDVVRLYFKRAESGRWQVWHTYFAGPGKEAVELVGLLNRGTYGWLVKTDCGAGLVEHGCYPTFQAAKAKALEVLRDLPEHPAS